MRTLKAIIFDMDGVIIDSEPQHGRAALKVLHKYGADADMSYPFVKLLCYVSLL